MKLPLALFAFLAAVVLGEISRSGVTETEHPFAMVRYNISCPIRRTFIFHMWLVSKPLEVSLVSVSNGISSKEDSGFLKGTIPPRHNADFHLSVVLKHNCRRDGKVIVSKEEIGTCLFNKTSCSFFYSKNLLETVPGHAPTFLPNLY